MLNHLTWKDDETVIAEGPKFDLDRVLAFSVVVLRRLLEAGGLAWRGERPFYGIVGRSRREPYEDAAEDRLIDAVRTMSGLYDVCAFIHVVEIGPLKIRLGPLGFYHLYRMKKNRVVQRDGEPWADLDVEPAIMVHGPSGRSSNEGVFGQLTDDERRLVTEVFRRFTPLGAEMHLHSDGLVPSLAWLRFPHEAFGEDDLRPALRERDETGAKIVPKKRALLRIRCLKGG
jgi:hypothetical protein